MDSFPADLSLVFIKKFDHFLPMFPKSRPIVILVEESSDNAVLSTLKKAEKAEGFVLRFFNPTEGEVQSRFTFNPSVDQVQEGNLNEKALAPLKVENNQ
jgi:alpha-mannosidase